MKNLKLLLCLLCACTVGGVNSVKAERTYGSISVVYQATWDSGTNTMGWKEAGEGKWYILSAGLPTGNITAYTTFHATLTNFSDNADFIRLIIKDGTNQDVVRLVEGENYVDLTTLPNCDYTKITEVNLWGSDAAKEGQTIDADHPASVVVTDVYMVKPDAPFVTTKGDFGEEITELSYITGGTRFVIGDGTNAMYWIGSSVDNQKANVNNVPSDAYYYYVLEKVDGLDTDGDGNVENDNYRIKIENASGTAYPHPWGGHGPYLNYSIYGHLWVSSCDADKGQVYGGDGQYYAIWKAAYSEGNGFTLKNAAVNKYVKVIGTSDAATYLKFYKSIEFTNTTTYPANDEIFALSDAEGYDSETGILENGGWTFETPVDLSNWAYLIITVENTSRSTDTYIKITDESGNIVEKSNYDPEEQPEMYFGTYNNHNAACISMDFLRNKGLDISKIKSLSFSGQELKISSVYLTDYENTKLGPSRGRYTCYVAGDEVRPYNAEEVGKFGTVCLPYKASVAGAEVYSIESGDATGITLTKVNGLLEAGKPYFYKASDVTGKNDNEHNVNFFRADFDHYDAATPARSNGMIGTFSQMTAPAGTNYWILSGNQLYNTEDATGEYAVTIGANKAYVDTNLIPTGPSSSRSAFIPFDESTGIHAVQDNVMTKQLGIYNLNGQRLNQLKKGLNIINGKKVMVK